jgi:hypothetical protein
MVLYRDPTCCEHSVIFVTAPSLSPSPAPPSTSHPHQPTQVAVLEKQRRDTEAWKQGWEARLKDVLASISFSRCHGISNCSEHGHAPIMSQPHPIKQHGVQATARKVSDDPCCATPADCRDRCGSSEHARNRSSSSGGMGDQPGAEAINDKKRNNWVRVTDEQMLELSACLDDLHLV